MTYFEMTKTVVKSLFSRPATLMYPAKPAKRTNLTRGHVTINPDGCITCRSCQRKCPTQAICVEPKEKTWQIDRLRCIVCNCCVEVCPTKCLAMDTQYTAAMTTRAGILKGNCRRAEKEGTGPGRKLTKPVKIFFFKNYTVDRRPLLNRSFQQFPAIRRDRLDGLNPGSPFIISPDHGPRRDLRIGPGQHLIDCNLVLSPFFPVPPVVLRDLIHCLSGSFLRWLKRLSCSSLLISSQNFNIPSAGRINKIRLHIVDLPTGPLPLVFCAVTLHPFHQNTAIPAPVEDRNVARFWEIIDKPPEIMVTLFPSRRGR
jgi:ech hydrogenase subunit F